MACTIVRTSESLTTDERLSTRKAVAVLILDCATDRGTLMLVGRGHAGLGIFAPQKRLRPATGIGGGSPLPPPTPPTRPERFPS